MKNEGMNEITIELGKVNANFNLRIRGTDHVELRTWNSAHPPHHAEVVFYSVDPKQVLEQFIELLNEGGYLKEFYQAAHEEGWIDRQNES